MKIAIIGGGIVGETAAFYLAKQTNIQIDIYDDDWISGTKAAVGIICPWVNQRRNATWYKLVEQGANFYSKLIQDLGTDSFIKRSGCLVINSNQHTKLLNIALERAINNPIMGDVKEVTMTSMNTLIPESLSFDKAIDIPGAFQVDGNNLLKIFASVNNNINRITSRVILTSLNTINSINYDYIVITAGAGLTDILKFDDFTFDFYSQKGMLLEYNYPPNNYRIIMPKGEIDILFNGTKLIVGASHENNYNNLEYNQNIANQLITNATQYIDLPSEYTYRIGLRGHTSKNLPFYGPLNEYPNIIVAGGLGSSGLTSGPIIGYRIADYLINMTPFIDDETNPNLYIKNA